jgi:hypothetical protein
MHRLLAALLLLHLSLAGACEHASSEGDESASVATAVPTSSRTPGDNGPASSRTPGVTGTLPTSESPLETSSPTPTAVPTPSCEQGKEDRRARYDRAETKIEEAMAGYEGTWSLAVIDLDCRVIMEINPEYVQYTASAGKIVVVIAALRAVQAGTLRFENIDGHLDEILHHSNDANSDAVNEMVTPAQVQEVLRLSGVSELTDFQHSWRYGFMTATDLARVWEALLRGQLLNNRWTKYLLRLAAEVDLPPEYATFPGRFDRPGYQYGQKAGYYVSDGVPYFMLGAGYLRPKDGSSLGFAMVFMMKTTNPELLDPQRRSVFPLIIEAILDG